MNVREQITNKLIAAGGFWSYDEKSVRENLSDEQLIEGVLAKLDLDDIDLLFRMFSAKKIKDVWRRTMVVQGDFTIRSIAFTPGIISTSVIRIAT